LGLLLDLVAGGAKVGCSAVTVGEIYAGMRPHEAERTGELIGELEVYPVTSEIARSAGLLKNEWRVRGYTFTLADMTIAATALAHGLILITDNLKDFPMAGLRVRGI
jgi:predicted nucleic acid-binding protein